MAVTPGTQALRSLAAGNAVSFLENIFHFSRVHGHPERIQVLVLRSEDIFCFLHGEVLRGLASILGAFRVFFHEDCFVDPVRTWVDARDWLDAARAVSHLRCWYTPFFQRSVARAIIRAIIRTDQQNGVDD